MSDGTTKPSRLAPPEAIGGLRRERLRWARLYFVCDALPHGDKPESMVRAALAGGAGMVELRDRDQPRPLIDRSGGTFRRLADTYSALFIVNDDPHLARELDADGVHVGQEDIPPAEAREILGPDAIVGLSTHSLEQIEAAHEQPVDYISVGPDLGDPDQGGPPRHGAGADRGRGQGRDAALVRDRRDRPGQRRRGDRGRGTAGLRRAGDPRRGRPGGGSGGHRRPARGGRQGRAGAAAAGLMGSRERKREQRRKRKRRSTEGSPSAEALVESEAAAGLGAGAAAAESFSERMSRRSEQKNQAVRDSLEPLPKGERPGAVTVGSRRLGRPVRDPDRVRRAGGRRRRDPRRGAESGADRRLRGGGAR